MSASTINIELSRLFDTLLEMHTMLTNGYDLSLEVARGEACNHSSRLPSIKSAVISVLANLLKEATVNKEWNLTQSVTATRIVDNSKVCIDVRHEMYVAVTNHIAFMGAVSRYYKLMVNPKPAGTQVEVNPLM